MKLATSLTFGVALALGTTGLVMSAPAQAKKEKAPAAASVQLSKEYRTAVIPIQADVVAGKLDGISARLDALSPFQAPDERYTTAALRYAAAKKSNNTAEIRKGVIGMIDSGSTSVTNGLQLNVAAGQMAFNAKDYVEATARLTEAVRLGYNDADTFIILAESSFQTGKVNEGLAFAEQAVAAKQAAGLKAPEDWYRRALSVAFKAKNATQIAKWSRLQLAAYPTAENWRTTLVLYRDGTKLPFDQSIDLFRLMRVTKSLAGERDFYEYATLTADHGLPGEAKAVLEEGMASAAIGKGNKALNEVLGSVSAKVAGDQASLGAAERQSNNAATGKPAAATADAFMGYGQDARAVALYKVALQKGQVDADTINTRMGIALARQGLNAEAKQALGLVTGTRADIAKFWLTWLNLKG